MAVETTHTRTNFKQQAHVTSGEGRFIVCPCTVQDGMLCFMRSLTNIERPCPVTSPDSWCRQKSEIVNKFSIWKLQPQWCTTRRATIGAGAWRSACSHWRWSTSNDWPLLAPFTFFFKVLVLGYYDLSSKWVDRINDLLFHCGRARLTHVCGSFSITFDQV